MNNNMIKGMIITYAEMGIVVDDFDNTDEGVILLFTVPNSSYHIDANNIEMSGKHLASRVKKTLEEMGVVFKDIRYSIRNEHWDEMKAKEAKQKHIKILDIKTGKLINILRGNYI